MTDVTVYLEQVVCQDPQETSSSSMLILHLRRPTRLKHSEKSLDNTCLQCVVPLDPRE